jgi:hypothetical protein
MIKGMCCSLVLFMAWAGLALAQSEVTTTATSGLYCLPAISAPNSKNAEGGPPPVSSPYWPSQAGPGSLPAPAPAADGDGAPLLGCASDHNNNGWNSGSCCNNQSIWFRSEYLLWWIKDPRVPTLAESTPGQFAHSDPLPVSSVLFGNSNIDFEERSGGRFTLGGWLDSSQCLGLETSYFFLDGASVRFVDSSGGDPTIGRVIISTGTGRPTLIEDAVPNFSTGSVGAHLNSRLWGIEANALTKTSACFSDHLVLLGGFRYLSLDEGLEAEDTENVLPSVQPPPTLTFQNGPAIPVQSITTVDSFGVHNQFYGAQIGGHATFCGQHWFADVIGKIALGDTHETVDIRGNTSITSPGGAVTNIPRGLLAQPTNIGRYCRDEFAAVPEVTINVGYQFNEYLRVFMGYNFLYISDVARPADAVNLHVNTSQVPGLGTGFLSGTPQPTFSFKDSEFWAQGINFGLQVHY